MTRVEGRYAALLAGLGAVVVTVLSGCGTFAETRDSWPEPSFYGGIQFDAEAISEGVHFDFGPCSFGPFVFLMGVFDLPFSFVADTLLVPVNTVLWTRSEKPEDPSGGCEAQSLAKIQQDSADAGEAR